MANFLDELLGLGAHAASHESGASDAIRGDYLEIAYSPSNYTPADVKLGSHLAGIDTALGWAGAPSSPNHSIPYNNSGAFAWSTTVFCAGTWLGFAATEAGLPSTGEIRLGASASIVGKFTSGDAAIATVNGNELDMGATTLDGFKCTSKAAGVFSFVFDTTTAATIDVEGVHGFLEEAEATYFGDGSDGNATITTTVTLTDDAYYADLTISGSGQLITAGYRVFVLGTLDLSNAAAQAIVHVLPASSSSYGIPGGSGGNSATVGGGQDGSAGHAGGSGVGTNGTAGTDAPYGLGGDAGSSGAAGSGDSGAGGSGASGGEVLDRLTIGRFTTGMLYGANGQTGGAGGASGGSGAGDGGSSVGGQGSGGGGGGGTIWIAARTVARGASTAAGVIDASGGNGGYGSAGSGGTNVGGGAGGGGGGGGAVLLFYGQLTGSSVSGAIVADGGRGGSGGDGIGTGTGGYGGNGGDGGSVLLYDVLTNASGFTLGTGGSAGSAPSGTSGGIYGAGGTCSVTL